ncbi:unnamed protein product, partial [Medioppia subpectinata]
MRDTAHDLLETENRQRADRLATKISTLKN